MVRIRNKGIGYTDRVILLQIPVHVPISKMVFGVGTSSAALRLPSVNLNQAFALRKKNAVPLIILQRVTVKCPGLAIAQELGVVNMFGIPPTGKTRIAAAWVRLCAVAFERDASLYKHDKSRVCSERWSQCSTMPMRVVFSGETFVCFHSRRTGGVKTSGRAGKNLNICRDFEVPDSNSFFIFKSV